MFRRPPGAKRRNVDVRFVCQSCGTKWFVRAASGDRVPYRTAPRAAALWSASAPVPTFTAGRPMAQRVSERPSDTHPAIRSSRGAGPVVIPDVARAAGP
jgi:hypothetical protein